MENFSTLVAQTYNQDTINKAQQKALMYIDPRSIKIDLTMNTRTEYELEPLELFIRINGCSFDPIVVYRIEKDPNHKYGLIRGFRRLLSTLSIINDVNDPIDIKTIPCIIKDKPTTEQCVFENLYSNNGKQLTIMETACAYKRLIDFQWTVSDIATRLAKSEGNIYQMLTLANAPMALHKIINNERITPSVARKVIEQHGYENATTILTNMVNDIDSTEPPIQTITAVTHEPLEQLSLFEEDIPKVNIAVQNSSIEVIPNVAKNPTKVVKKNKKNQIKITEGALKTSGVLKSPHEAIIQKLIKLDEPNGNIEDKIVEISFIIEMYETYKSEPKKLYTLLSEYYMLSSKENSTDGDKLVAIYELSESLMDVS